VLYLVRKPSATIEDDQIRQVSSTFPRASSYQPPITSN